MAGDETTRERIRRIVAEDPRLNLSEIARLVGVSRERVRQLVEAEGLSRQVRRGRRGATHGLCIRCEERPASSDTAKYCAQCRGLVVGWRHEKRRGGQACLPRVRTGGVPIPQSSVVVGTVSELLVTADLTARGFHVFVPIRRTARCDLVTMDHEGAVERIEVRSGSRTKSGRLVWLGKPSDACDRYAIVVYGEPVRYDPAFPGDTNDATGDAEREAPHG